MKRKIASLMLTTMLLQSSMPIVNTFANEIIENNEVVSVQDNEVVSVQDNEVVSVQDIENEQSIENISSNENNEKIQTVSKFTIKDQPEFSQYNKEFRVSIKNVKSNTMPLKFKDIKNIIDDNFKTHWESVQKNTDNFKNEIVFELKEVSEINRIAYATRQDAIKKYGFPIDSKIYVSESGNDNDFVLVGEYKNIKETGDMVEFKFNTTKAKKVKFVFEKIFPNYPSASEMWIYKEDTLLDKVENIFKDSTHSELKDEFNSISTIVELEKQAKSHPLKTYLNELLNKANELVEAGRHVTVMELPQNGNIMEKATKDLLMASMGTNLIPTGVVAVPNEVIEIYVEADSNKLLPKVVFSQSVGSYSVWQRKYELKPGYNKFIVPKMHQADWKAKINPGGAIYLENAYTAEQQGKAPKVTIYGGKKYPLFRQGDNVEEFLKELDEYTKFIKANPTTAVDIFEYDSPRMLFSGTATEANKVYNEEKMDVEKSTLIWSNVIDDMLKYAGLSDDAKEKYNNSTGIKANIRIMQPFAAAYAATDHVGLQRNIADHILRDDPKSEIQVRWAFTHEVGHQLDNLLRKFAEVTNNMWANEEYLKHGNGDRVDYNTIYSKVASDIETKYTLDFFARLGTFWQLRIAKDDYWQELETMYRTRRPKVETYQEKCDTILEYISEIFGVNLTEHFTRGGYAFSKSTLEKLKKYPESTKKYWYLNNSAIGYKGTGFNENVKLDTNINLNKTNKTLNLYFNIDKENSNDLLGYEIKKDGKVLGFTTSNSYLINNINPEENEVFEVTAYAKNLVPSKAFKISSLQPKVHTTGGVTLKLNEEFNPLDYIKIIDSNGNELSDIKVTNNVDTSKAGVYKVYYELEYDGNKIEKEIIVNVTNSLDYLSDMDFSDIKLGYGSYYINESIKGRELGEIKSYEKGIRIHANSEITYNLGEHNYENFEAKFGVDMNINEQNNSSIQFEIYGDGKLLAKTPILKYSDDLFYINVPVKDVKEIKIQLKDGGNGNTSDHSVIVEPKLLTNNAKPKLIIPESLSVFLNSSLEDLKGTYSAFDPEDGDLTDKVIVSGLEEVDLNKVGNYTIKYSITDSDGNTTEKTRIISVIEESEYSYVSDLDIKSSTHTYQKEKKDLAINLNKIRLTGQDGKEIVYDKGLGVHSVSNIIYDLTDKNAALFTSYVGVDRTMYGTVGSVRFELYADNKKVYDSGVMYSKDPQKFVSVNVVGVKELKLVVTDGGNGNGSDHANWADTKLYYVNEDKEKLSTVDEEIKETNKLSDAINEAIKIDLNKYTEDSYKNLENYINEAKQILNDNVTDENIINSTIDKIKNAISSLILLEDTNNQNIIENLDKK